MGENERRRENPASGLLPNGLLPNEAASVIRPLDVERWSKAEARIAELIRIIKPNKPSEDQREAVANYVQRLILQCFPCEVFTFGSVPLKTYLPDGDIDVTVFSNNQNLKETWAHQVRDILESEEKNESAEFHVKEVQYIQAEVKIVKCLVENIVVDISFNQLGGLCTLCFLEEVDNLINQDHLFKRSIILIKAWCYYESRILGAHHGLISTYALETLVLYIFHVFNNSFLGPLEVLYRFLEFFSKFDWDNFCVSLWGPVSISSLPDVTAEPPRQDGGDLLLSKLFLEACSAVYADYPAGQENQGQPFVSKYFNVIDPLRVNNNLGRSVSKGNFFRIRSAFAFGAKRLARLLNCSQEDMCFEVNQFFTNTWDRHGSGQRPDVPRNFLPYMRLSNADQSEKSHTSGEDKADLVHTSRAVPFLHTNYPVESTSRSGKVSSLSHLQNKKYHVSSNNTMTHDQTRREIGSNHGVHMEKSEKSSKPDGLAADQGKCFFVRTHSSPELTDSYASLQGRRDRSSERGKNHKSSARLDVNQKNNLDSNNLASHSSRSSTDDPSSVRHTPSCQSFDDVADSDGVANSYHDDSGAGVNGEQLVYPLGSHVMDQEEQDLVNMMAASTGLGYSGQVQSSLSLVPGNIPRPFSPSVLASMGHLPRNMGGLVPANIPLLDSPWGTTMQFPQGVVSPQPVHYFPAVELSSNPDDRIELGNENFSPAGTSPGEDDNDCLREQDGRPIAGSDLDNGVLEMHHSENSHPPASSSYNYVHPSLSRGSASSSRVKQRSTKANIGSIREDHISSFPFQEENDSDHYVDDRATNERAFSIMHSTLGSTSPESSLEEPSWRVSKLEKRGRKTSAAELLTTVHGRSKSVSQHYSDVIDDDNKHWNQLPDVGHQMIEGGMGLVGRREEPVIEPAQTRGSESLIPIAPVLVHPVSQRGATDYSGAVPLALYPAGLAVPFVAMLPFTMYNFPTETGTSDPSVNQLYREDGLDSADSVQNFDSSEDLDQSEILSTSHSAGNTALAEPIEQKTDILNSDFASHWQNLQFGRFCQNSRSPAPMIYQSPNMVPPVYLQGCFPMEAPGRPSSANMNLVTQPMSYGPRVLPVAPLQSIDMPRYRGGTGTYLPMPRASVQGRHVNSRKGSTYAMNEKSDRHGDREGNWNSSKYYRGTRRSHNRSQPERSNLRVDRSAASENWTDRPWRSHKQGMLPEYQSQNGPIHLSSSQSGSPSVAYSMYPVTSTTPVGGPSNGLPVVMFYPYNHNTGYASHPEFGSLGPVRHSGSNEVLHLREGNQPGGGFEGQRLHGSSGRQSSPDQPSSPNFER